MKGEFFFALCINILKLFNKATIQNRFMLFLLILFLLFPLFNMSAESIFVDQKAQSNGNGTKEKPFKKIQDALDVAMPGVTILVAKGVYSENLVVSQSGIKGKWIELKAQEKCEVVLDGSKLKVKGSLDMVYINNISYFSMRNIEIRNLKATKYEKVVSGISINGLSHHIKLSNLNIHHIEAKTAKKKKGDAHAIIVRGNSEFPIHQLSIKNCLIHQCKLGSSEALVLNGNVKDFIVAKNHIKDVDNIAIDFIGYEMTCENPLLDYTRDGVCVDNKIERVSSKNNPVYRGEKSAGGIYVDGGANIIIERNIVEDCNIGIEIASEHKGKKASDIIIRNNIIKRSYQSGILMGGFNKNKGEVHRVRILNNTLIENDLSNWNMGELGFQYYVIDCIVENNLFIKGERNKEPVYISLTSAKKIPKNLTLNHNAYFSIKNSGYWQFPKRIKKFNDWIALNNEIKSINLSEYCSNVKAALASDVLINSGVNRSENGEYDYNGLKRLIGEGIDIGAVERN